MSVSCKSSSVLPPVIFCPLSMSSPTVASHCNLRWSASTLKCDLFGCCCSLIQPLSIWHPSSESSIPHNVQFDGTSPISCTSFDLLEMSISGRCVTWLILFKDQKVAYLMTRSQRVRLLCFLPQILDWASGGHSGDQKQQSEIPVNHID